MLLPVLTLSGCSGIPISHSQWLIATDWRTPSRTGSTAQPGSAVTGCPEASGALALTSTSPCGLRDTQHHDRRAWLSGLLYGASSIRNPRLPRVDSPVG